MKKTCNDNRLLLDELNKLDEEIQKSDQIVMINDRIFGLYTNQEPEDEELEYLDLSDHE